MLWVGAWAAAVVAAGWWRSHLAVEVPAPTVAASVATPNPGVGLAASLQGTRPDGRLHAGDAELVLSAELVRRFDYWLTAHGEKPLVAIRADIQSDLARELNPASSDRGLRLFDAYVAYKSELARLQPEPSGRMDADALGRQLQAIRTLRSRHFAADEVVALFGGSDADDDHALSRLRIAQDPSLTEAARRQRLQQLSAQRSPEQRAAETEPVLHLAVSDAVAEARARGADAAEVRSIRTRMVGADAAERLARVDADQAAWQSRVQVYLALRQSQSAEAAAHKSTHFSPTEQLRLGAYE